MCQRSWYTDNCHVHRTDALEEPVGSRYAQRDHHVADGQPDLRPVQHEVREIFTIW